MEKKLVGYTADKSRLQNTNDELSREIDNLHNRIESLEVQRATLAKRNSELAVAVTVSENKLMDLQKDFKKVTSLKSSLEDNKGKQDGQLSQLNQQLEQADTAAKKLADQNKTLSADKERLIELKNNLLSENSRLSKMKQSLQGNLEREQNELDHWQTL